MITTRQEASAAGQGGAAQRIIQLQSAGEETDINCEESNTIS